MKKLKDILAQKRKAIQDKQEQKRAKVDEDPAEGEDQRKVRVYLSDVFSRAPIRIAVHLRLAMQDHENVPGKPKSPSRARTSQSSDATAAPLCKQHTSLADVEVRRRLRRLGHPVTLFAETDSDRHDRYRHVERTFEVTDEGAVGGERANVLHTILKEDRLKAKEAAMQSGHGMDSGKATPPKQQGNENGDGEEVCTQLRWAMLECSAGRKQTLSRLALSRLE